MKCIIRSALIVAFVVPMLATTVSAEEKKTNTSASTATSTRDTKPKSDVESKYQQTVNGIAQNIRG